MRGSRIREQRASVPAQTHHLPEHQFSRFGFALSCTLTQSRRPIAVSVRRLAGLGEKKADDGSLSTYRKSSRYYPSPQLPAPRTNFDVEFYIWYTALVFKILKLSTGD